MSDTAVTPAPNAEPAAPVTPPAAAPAAPPADPATPPASPASLPDWMGGLSDDLKADPTLARYQSVDDLAKGHIEAHRTAKSKAVMPGDSFDNSTAFLDAVRPESADLYKIEFADGHDGAQGKALADHMRPVFHKVGLQPWQVDALVSANNEFLQSQMSQNETAAQDGMTAFKAEWQNGGRDYDRQMGAVKSMMGIFGIDADQIDLMETQIGGANTMKFLFGLADKVAEQPTVQGQPPSVSGNVTPAEARNVYNQKLQDADWRAKAQIDGAPENAEMKRLVAQMAKANLPPQQ